MMKQKINLFRYQGNKFKFLSDINPIIRYTRTNTYVEPFLGSGSIFLNLEKEFESYHLNDIASYYTEIIKTFRTIDFKYIQRFYDNILTKFGNIGRDKEAYYRFRDFVNHELDGHDYNLGIFYLSRSCINGMIRFGPNGFNQGWGDRGYDIGIAQGILEEIKNRLSTEVKITNYDYEKLEYLNTENTIWLLDPPYVETPTNYNNGFEFDRFKKWVKGLKGDIIYFDIENEFGDSFFIDKIILRNIKEIAPSSLKKDRNLKEVMYTNIKTNKLF